MPYNNPIKQFFNNKKQKIATRAVEKKTIRANIKTDSRNLVARVTEKKHLAEFLGDKSRVFIPEFIMIDMDEHGLNYELSFFIEAGWFDNDWLDTGWHKNRLSIEHGALKKSFHILKDSAQAKLNQQAAEQFSKKREVRQTGIGEVINSQKNKLL